MISNTATFDPLDSRRLLGFVLIAKSGSIATAAQGMRLTPSAMSHALKALEEDLGCQLFERRGHKAILTGAGERLLPRAERIISEMTLARDEQRQFSQWGCGTLRVGASAAACQYFLPDVLLEFRECFPNCELDVISVDAQPAVEMIRNGELDLAICVLESETSQLASQPLFEDELILVVNPLHPWAKLSRVTAKELKQQKLSVYNRNSVSTALVRQHLQQLGAERVSFLTISSMEAIKEMARVGLCPGVVASWVAQPDLLAGTLKSVRLSGPRLKRQWVALWPEERPLNIMAQTLVGLCRDVTTALATPALD
jgi:LysR family transcriptional regulator, low CO2-responsive transcriptional regulator